MTRTSPGGVSPAGLRLGARRLRDEVRGPVPAAVVGGEEVFVGECCAVFGVGESNVGGVAGGAVCWGSDGPAMAVVGAGQQRQTISDEEQPARCGGEGADVAADGKDTGGGPGLAAVMGGVSRLDLLARARLAAAHGEQVQTVAGGDGCGEGQLRAARRRRWVTRPPSITVRAEGSGVIVSWGRSCQASTSPPPAASLVPATAATGV